ncbi:ankyrin-2-like [Lineus longissimus]|uniref:ankyrin-2-like n=1 Tax=Lineus longissimus TaxID=88925 RepID=UPI00315D023B
MAESADDADKPVENHPLAGDTSAWSNIQILLRDLIIFRSPLKDIDVALDCGGAVNGPIIKGLRPLHYAVYDNNVDCAAHLLEKGADIDIADAIDYRPVHIAAKHGSFECLKLLIEQGAQLNFVNDTTQSLDAQALGYLSIEPINLAISNNHINCTRLLLENGVSPNNRYFLGNEINVIPLENLKCLELLLEFGANPNSLSRSGYTPLMTACKEQNLDAVKTLLEYKADIDFKSLARFDEKRALYFAILGGNVDLTTLLLEHGAYKRCIGRNTHALTFAVSCGLLEICKLLLAHGANVKECNEDGLTPLLAACTTHDCQKEIIALLLQHGADPNVHCELAAYDLPSLTPLYEYFVYQRKPSLDITQLLLRYGARISFRQATRNCLIKDPFGFLTHFPKLLEREELLDLILSASESFSPSAIIVSPDLKDEEKGILLSLAVPVRLKHLARLSIRTATGLVFPEKVERLPLPTLLKSYLLYDVY